MEPSKEEVGVSLSDKAINLSKNTPVTFSVVSTEPAKLQAKVEFDLEIQKIVYKGNTNIIDLAEFKLNEGSGIKIYKSLDLTSLINEFEFKEGSRTKIDKSLELTFLVKIFFVLASLYFSILGAEEFRTIMERRWEEVRSKPFNPEQM